MRLTSALPLLLCVGCIPQSSGGDGGQKALGGNDAAAAVDGAASDARPQDAAPHEGGLGAEVGPRDAARPPDIGPDECLPQVGDWYSFDTFFLTDIAGEANHGAVGNLNTIWAADIERTELNVLFEVIESSVDAVRVRAINAARVDGGQATCLRPETATELQFERTANELVMAERAGLNLYAGTASIPKFCSPGGDPKHTIPIRDARIEATMAADCSAITQARTLEAVLYAEDLRSICACISPTAGAEECGALDADYTGFNCDGCNPFHRSLEGLLQALTGLNDQGERVLYETGEDGQQRVRLTAGFTAQRIESGPVDCD